MKTLDMADKYPPAEDDYPTVKMQVCPVIPLVVVSDEGEDFDLHGQRDTIPSPPSYPNDVEGHTETRYPGIGLLIVFGTSFIFWGALAYFLCR